MTREEFFRLVPARQFFTEYCPEVKNYYHKLRGEDGNKKPIDFTKEDIRIMKKAASRLGRDLKDVVF